MWSACRFRVRSQRARTGFANEIVPGIVKLRGRRANVKGAVKSIFKGLSVLRTVFHGRNSAGGRPFPLLFQLFSGLPFAPTAFILYFSPFSLLVVLQLLFLTVVSDDKCSFNDDSPVLRGARTRV